MNGLLRLHEQSKSEDSCEHNYLYLHFSQQVIFAYYYLMNCIGMIDTPQKITEIFKIQYNFFCHLNVTYQSVSVHLENAAELMHNLLEELEINKGKGEGIE
jgi:hypothetical protein